MLNKAITKRVKLQEEPVKESIELAMMGWLGPIGVAAIFYKMYVLINKTFEVIWESSSFVIILSTLVHIISDLSVYRWYART